MWEKIQNKLKGFAGALLEPLIILSLAGMILIVGYILALEFMPETLQLVGNFIMQVFLDVGFTNLPVIFCIGLTVGLSKKKKGDAAILGIASLMVFLFSNHTWLDWNGMLAEPIEDLGLAGTGQSTVLGLQIVDMGVFMGVLLGCMNAFFMNKLGEVKFDGIFSMFGGATLATLVAIIFAMVFGVAACYFWPAVDAGITALAGFLANSGNIGLFLYGFLYRLLISTGLHHMLYMPLYYTQLGGTAVVNGVSYAGADVIFMAEFTNIDAVTVMDESIKWKFCGFPQMCGSIAATLAFLRTASPDQRDKVKKLLLPALMLVLVVGITEPFEFSFMFTAPLLWLAHSILDGASQVLIFVLGNRMSIDGGLLDAVIDVILLPMDLTHAWVLVPAAIVTIIVWYFVFVFLIRRFHFIVPGQPGYDFSGADFLEEREARSNDEDPLAASAASAVEPVGAGMDEIDYVIEGLGGADNIEFVTNCVTRLRVDVKDLSLLNEDMINHLRNSGIVKKGNNVQVIIGVTVPDVRARVCERLGMDY